MPEDISDHTEPQIHNDEPADDDALGRGKYIKTFARMAATADTPLVVGMFGGWGTGKSSLMKQVQKELDERKQMDVLTVWFNPWEHQFDDNPVLGLLHALTKQNPVKEAVEELKKLTTVILGGGLSWLLKTSTGLNVDDINKFGVQYEEERFQLKEDQTRLREYFESVINTARGERRVVFFIDDLDRCMPAQALKLVEALKLCLNFKGCAYFLGVDRKELARSIRHHYKEIFDKEDSSAESYLDKIVQLPFNIPPIAVESMKEYIGSLIGKDGELNKCRKILVHGLKGTPRGVKRFINTLTLNHLLASGLNIDGYDIRILAAILLIQEKAEPLYKIISMQPEKLLQLKTKDESVKDLNEEYLDKDEGLRGVVFDLEIDEQTPLREYIHLTQTTRQEGSEAVIDLESVLKQHEKWLKSSGEKGQMADLREADLGGADLGGADLVGADLGGAFLGLANLTKANLHGADLGGANLGEANLVDANLREADLGGANLGGAFLDETNLDEANLTKANLSEADLGGANLTKANLVKADLVDANLREADLVGANLGRANLRGADLSGAKLSRANLVDADLSGAILREADLVGANLRRANLTGADLSTARGLTVDQIRSAIYDNTTKLRSEIRKALEDNEDNGEGIPA